MGFWLRFRYPKFFFADSALLVEYHRQLALTRQMRKKNVLLIDRINRLKEGRSP